MARLVEWAPAGQVAAGELTSNVLGGEPEDRVADGKGMLERGDHDGAGVLVGDPEWVAPSSRTGHDNCAGRFAPACSPRELHSPSDQAWGHRPPAAWYSATIAFGIRPRDGTWMWLAAAHSRSEPTSKPRPAVPLLTFAEARWVVVRLVAGAGVVRRAAAM